MSVLLDASLAHRSFGVARQYALKLEDIKPWPLAAIHNNGLAGTSVTYLDTRSKVFMTFFIVTREHHIAVLAGDKPHRLGIDTLIRIDCAEEMLVGTFENGWIYHFDYFFTTICLKSAKAILHEPVFVIRRYRTAEFDKLASVRSLTTEDRHRILTIASRGNST